MSSREHWESVYEAKPTDTVSWYQPHAVQSLRLIEATQVPRDAHVLDAGGGASTLVDDLLDAGYTHVTVVDLSTAALVAAQARLGARAASATWLAADVTTLDLPPQSIDVWHDRAVFHFLTKFEDRRAYIRTVLRAVRPGGHVIVATFAEDGPEKCSGLPVMRYSATTLHAEFGEAFTLVAHDREAHATPFGTSQQFTYCYCRVAAGA